jgi:hypothetical protein
MYLNHILNMEKIQAFTKIFLFSTRMTLFVEKLRDLSYTIKYEFSRKVINIRSVQSGKL